MDIYNNIDDHELVQDIHKRRKISVEARNNSSSHFDGYFLQLSDQYLEDKSRTMAMANEHVDENISLRDKNLKFELGEINFDHHRSHCQITDNSLVPSNDFSDRILKSKLNIINNESQNSSEGQPQKRCKTYTLYCSSCNAIPSNCEINVCKNCDSSMIYSCRDCNYKCNKYKSMCNHYRYYHEVGQDYIIHCLLCDKKAYSKDNLLTHYKRFHADEAKKMKWNRQFLQFYLVSKSENLTYKKYKCHKCNYSNSDLINVKQHIRIEHDPTLYKSIKKQKELQKQTQLNNQETNITDEVAIDLTCHDLQKLYSGFTLQCSSCKVPPRNGRASNCEGCNEPMIYRCLIVSCNFSCNKYNTIHSHYTNKHKHNSDRIIHCLHCDKECVSKLALRSHYRKFHPIEKAKVTNKKEQYAKFYTVSKSADNKDYQCYKCDYISLDLVAVKNHIRDQHDSVIFKSIEDPKCNQPTGTATTDDANSFSNYEIAKV